MNLFKKSKNIKQKILNSLSEEDDRIEVAYWRKDYLIHEWFCEHFEVENCGDIEVTKEDLLLLVEYIKENIKDGGEWDNLDEEENEKLNKVSIKVLNKIINETDWDNEEIIYWAWW